MLKEGGQPQALTIFVSGLPAKTTPEEILNHFLRFGMARLQKLSVTLDSEKSKGVSKITADIRRGFCVLIAADPLSFSGILGSSDSEFLGRRLGVQPLRTGSELADYNALINARRVILKRVPREIPEAVVHRQVEESFGTVLRLYRFESEDRARRRKSTRLGQMSSYSVEFHSIDSAVQAGNLFLLVIGEVKISVELYRRQDKGRVHSLPADFHCLKPTYREYHSRRNDGPRHITPK